MVSHGQNVDNTGLRLPVVRLLVGVSYLVCVLGFCVSLDFFFPRTILGAPEKIHRDSERMGRQPIPHVQ